MKFPRPRFSLLTLVLFSLTCGSGMLVYYKRHPWVKISATTPTLPEDEFKAGNLHIDYNQHWVHIWSDPPKVVDLYNKNEFAFSGERPPYPDSIVLKDKYLLAFIDVQWGGGSTFGEIWDLKSRKKIQTIPMLRHAPPWNFVMSPNGKYLFEGISVGDMWDLESGDQLPGTSPESIPHAALSPVGLELTREQSQKSQRERMRQAENLKDYLRAAHGPGWVLPDTEYSIRGPEISGVPYAIDIYAQVSNDGSRVVTVEKPSKVYHVWDGSTLKRLGSVTIPEYSVIGLTPDGSCMLAVSKKTRTMYDLVKFREMYQLPSLPDAHGLDYDMVTFPGDSDVMIEDISVKKEKGKKKVDDYQRIWNWRTGELLKTRVQFLTGGELFIDSTRQVSISSIVGFAGDDTYFNFKALDRNVERIVAIGPDKRYAITQDAQGQQQVWKQLRLEKYGSVLYVKELYLMIVMFVATVASLFYGLRRAA